ncbi:MAG: hypothetical protein KAI66_18010 [Lentisphaeria bacterium]|nr:hypothetical protein [Lentisphaeria bacterium]
MTNEDNNDENPEALAIGWLGRELRQVFSGVFGTEVSIDMMRAMRMFRVDCRREKSLLQVVTGVVQ